MKTKLKIKLVVVLSLSILLNVFLLWELKRKTTSLEKENRDLREKLTAATHP